MLRSARLVNTQQPAVTAHGSLAQWKAVEGGPLEWRDWRSGRQWKGDRWIGVTGAVEGSGRVTGGVA